MGRLEQMQYIDELIKKINKTKTNMISFQIKK